MDYNIFRFRLQWWWDLPSEYVVTTDLENFTPEEKEILYMSEEERNEFFAFVEEEEAKLEPLEVETDNERKIFINEDSVPTQKTFDEVVSILYQAVLENKKTGQPYLLKASAFRLTVFFKSPPKIVEANQREVVVDYQGKHTTIKVGKNACHHFPGLNVSAFNDLNEFMEFTESMGLDYDLDKMYVHMPNGVFDNGFGAEIHLSDVDIPEPGEEVYFTLDKELSNFGTEDEIRSELTKVFERVLHELTDPCLMS